MGKLSWVGGLGGNGNGSGENGAPRGPEAGATTWSPRLVVTATLIVLGIAAAFFLLFRFYMVVFLFLVAVMLGVATKPVVGWLQKRGVRAEIGVILVYLALLALVGVFIVIVAPMIAEQATSVVDRLPQYYTELRQALIDSNNRLVQRVALGLPVTLDFSLGAALNGEGGAAADNAATAAVDFTAAVHVVGNVLQSIFVVIAILALGFFWVREGEVLVRRILLLLPAERREPTREVYGEMEGKVAAYFRGQIILCGVVGIMSLVGYAAIGLPYALGLALIMAICEAIPMVGPLIGAVPALLVALALAPDKILWTVAIIFVIQTSENNLLVPRVMDRSVGINPIITILGITAFGALFGFAGALLAIPLTAMVQIVATRLAFREPAAPDVSRSRAGILRLAAQELIQDVRKSSRVESEETTLIDPEVERAEDLLEGIAVDLDKVLTDREVEESNAAGKDGFQ
ncbi:MAG: AI-2E family transporter [Anaerolineae bacterium]|jgi:predicted PurR-regulated permease PerM|nr:AI-2E family transporter [Anaerolineae bacterium]